MTAPQPIQPTGFHLSLSSDWRIGAVSANLGDFLPTTADRALGQPITALLGDDIVHDMRNRMALLRSEDMVEHLLRIPLSEAPDRYDLSIFRDGDGFAIDAEPSEGSASVDCTATLGGMIDALSAACRIDAIADGAARQLRGLTGFDRVLVFAGRDLLGECARPNQDRPPAAAIDGDVAPLAISDIAAGPVEILCAVGESHTRSTLRCALPHERAVIGALQARAALVIPLLREGRAWGQIGCYHGTARHLGVERRGVANLFARFVALKFEIAELRGD